MISISYGEEILALDLKKADVLTPPLLPALQNLDQALEEALANPVAQAPLKEILQAKKSLLLIVPDKTRNYSLPKLLPDFIVRLNRWGFTNSQIGVLIARGTHTRLNELEIDQVLSSQFPKDIPIFQHECDDEASLFLAGHSKRGTPIYLNRLTQAYEAIILIGGVLPHHFAGFGGGRKLVLPGISGRKTINLNHQQTFLFEQKALNPKTAIGLLQNNPIHEEMVEALNLLRPDFLINIILNGAGEISRLICGDCLQSHLSAVSEVTRNYFIPLPKKYDLVIASSGGYPKDLTLMQAYKALSVADLASKKGAAILLIAECRQGLGSDKSYHWMSIAAEDEYLEQLCQNYEVEARSIFAARKIGREKTTYFFTALSEDLVSGLNMKKIDPTEIGRLLKKHEIRGDSILVVPNGNSVVPIAAD